MRRSPRSLANSVALYKIQKKYAKVVGGSEVTRLLSPLKSPSANNLSAEALSSTDDEREGDPLPRDVPREKRKHLPAAGGGELHTVGTAAERNAGALGGMDSSEAELLCVQPERVQAAAIVGHGSA